MLKEDEWLKWHDKYELGCWKVKCLYAVDYKLDIDLFLFHLGGHELRPDVI